MSDGSVEVRLDVPYGGGPRGNLCVDLYLPAGAGPHPALLCLHGGAWLSLRYGHSCCPARRPSRLIKSRKRMRKEFPLMLATKYRHKSAPAVMAHLDELLDEALQGYTVHV